MRPALLVALLLLCEGCQETVAGQCRREAGHLCIVAQAVPPDTVTDYVIEVRAGEGCDRLCRPPTSAMAVAAECSDRVPTCKRSEKRGPISDLPRLRTEGELTADVDLAGLPGPVEVEVTLLDRVGACVLHAAGAPDTPETITLALSGRCDAWHPPCGDHVQCSPGLGRLCCRGRCVPPPPAPKEHMSFVPAGELVFGDPSPGAPAQFQPCKDDKGSPVRKTVKHPFFIDRFEATVGDYRACVTAGLCARSVIDGGCLPLKNDPSCTAQQGDPLLAMSCLTWCQARQFCEWRMGRPDSLPWEIEWEWAAGRGARPFPWGDAQPTCDHANFGICPPMRVLAAGPETALRGATPDTALYHMGGNVAEWVFDADGLTSWFNRCVSLPVPTGETRIFRGGSFRSSADFLKTTARQKLIEDETEAQKTPTIFQLGVRCVWRLDS
jgi:formylglycine-generating enzyme required for sulfatase activity